MKKRLLVMVLMCLALIGLNARASKAAEVDVLINKLLEKNVITQDEAVQLMEDMKKEGARETETMKIVVADTSKEEAKKNKQALPKWVENTTLSGDVRVRYQTEDISNDNVQARNRWRIRLRTGLDLKINDNWKAGIGLSSGGGADGSDPRSRNQTLENEFQAPSLRIDYAYGQYTPIKDFTVIAGKMKNPIWTTKDLIWDNDIRPDGVAVTYNFKASDKINFFITPAYFILEEEKAKDDPALIAIQPGVIWKINDKINFKIAGAYYDFRNVKGTDMSLWSSKTNSYVKTTTHAGEWNEKSTYAWVYDHDSTSLETELSVKPDSFIQYASVFGEYVKSDADADNTGWLAGFTVGDEKVSESGKWQFIYNYRNLEKDAWVDWMPDSDFYEGQTGIKGSEFELTLGLGKNVTFGIDYYASQPIKNPGKKDMSLLQADLVVKF
jgi:hypothetical protein